MPNKRCIVVGWRRQSDFPKPRHLKLCCFSGALASSLQCCCCPCVTPACVSSNLSSSLVRHILASVPALGDRRAPSMQGGGGQFGSVASFFRVALLFLFS